MHISSSKAPPSPSPVLSDPDGLVSRLVSQYLKEAQDQDALKGCMERDRAALISLARPFHHHYNAGCREFAPGVEALAEDGRVLRIGFSNSYRAITDEAALLKLAGPDGARLFEHTTKISLTLKDLPTSVMEHLKKDIRAALRRCGLPQSLIIKEEMHPVRWFHQERHRLFTPEQNAEIDKISPCTVTFRRPGIHNNEDSQDF
jgi:hypothetical protein